MSEMFRKGGVWLPTILTAALYVCGSMVISLVGLCQEPGVYDRMQTWHWPNWVSFWGTVLMAGFPTIKAFLDPIVQQTKNKERETELFHRPK
jgi:hypothetical protein